MNKHLYPATLVLGLVAALLSSCSRSYYAFNSAVPAYLGARLTQPAARPTPALATGSAPAASPATAPASAPRSLVVAPPKTTPAAVPAIPNTASVPTLATTPGGRATKPSLVQRVLLRPATRQLAKVKLRQDMAATTHTAKSKGLAVLFLVLGIIMTVIGLAAVAASALDDTGNGGSAAALLLFLAGIALTVIGIVGLIRW